MSNQTLEDIISVTILLITILSIAAFLAFKTGENSGRIEVASGQVVCVLVDTPDKTLKWECE